MRPTTILRGLIAGLGAGLFVLQAVTVGAQPNPSERDKLSDWRYQSGSSQTVGTYPGTLVCMDDASSGDKAKACTQYGLRLSNKTRVFPLVAGTPEVEKQIHSNAMTNKSVLIVGVEIPETGQIMASGVTPQPAK